jgi:1-acyl-sn-glycerol-3-phosphate acyltransferase
MTGHHATLQPRGGLPLQLTIRQLTTTLLAQPLALPLLRFFFRLKIEPPQQGWPETALVCANHASFFDPIVVGACYPRPLSYFARASLWKLPIVRQALDVLGGLPVDRSAPQLDIMRRTVAWLTEGRNILIFPEGTRTKTGTLGQLQTGPAMFARRAKVAIMPVYLHRTAQAWPRGWPLPALGAAKLTIVFGEALVCPDHIRGKAQDRWLTEHLSNWMQQQEQRLNQPRRSQSSRRPEVQHG